MLDDCVREDEVEGAARERQRHAVRPEKVQAGEPALASEHDAGVAESIDRIDADHLVGVLRKRQRHAAAATAGVEHAAAERHAGALEKCDDFRTPVVLEERVVVFGPEPLVGVGLDEVGPNLAHSGTCR